jgi:uncharacterized membrane-anchored protein
MINSLEDKQLLNKVPEITLYFWGIKILCTTVGETVADYLNETLHFGLTGTSLVMSGVLVIALYFQFRARKYIPPIYWFVVVLISVVGTLITDNLTDKFGVSLMMSTSIFFVMLMFAFVTWFEIEGTLSVHSINSPRREFFYWLVILLTFALGTASGDLLAEKSCFGYLASAFIFLGLILAVVILHYFLKKFIVVKPKYQSIRSVITFWLAYIFTRPLGASIGDYLSQDHSDGGLGLGTTTTSVFFLITILGLVIYLTITRKDEIASKTIQADVV